MKSFSVFYKEVEGNEKQKCKYTTRLDDCLYRSLDYEKASLPSMRIDAIKKLQDNGFDVAIRLSPLIEDFIDFDKLNNLGINKAQVEFLRVNHWIKNGLI